MVGILKVYHHPVASAVAEDQMDETDLFFPSEVVPMA